jgi:transketolase
MSLGELDRRTAELIRERRAEFPTKAVRQQFGESMLALAKERSDFLALTADLMHACGIAEFGAAYPDRLINLGVAEQNMAGVAAGLALCGKLPVLCGYAAFTALRAVEQAKVDCAYNGVKAVLVGQSAGLSYGVGGPTHQTYEDVAIMRAIPNMIVLVPSDPVEAHGLLRAALDHPGSRPIFLRLGRGPEYVFNAADPEPEIGRAVLLRSGGDLAIVANGAMVFEALLAAEALAEEGIESAVLNVHTVKPIDAKAIRAAAAQARSLLVVEEHNVLGGLGSAVLEVLENGHAPLRRIGINDFYPPIGPTFELRESLGLCAANIVVEARAAIAGGRGERSLPPGGH